MKSNTWDMVFDKYLLLLLLFLRIKGKLRYNSVNKKYVIKCFEGCNRIYVGFAGLTKEKCILPPGQGGERVAWDSEVTVSWTLRYGVEGGGRGVY